MSEETKKSSCCSLKFNEERILAALSYVWILCLIPLLLKRHDEYVGFHAKQGLVLFLCEVAGLLIYWLPLIGQLIFLCFVIVSVIGILQALHGKKWEIPVLGKYAQKLKI